MLTQRSFLPFTSSSSVSAGTELLSALSLANIGSQNPTGISSSEKGQSRSSFGSEWMLFNVPKFLYFMPSHAIPSLIIYYLATRMSILLAFSFTRKDSQAGHVAEGWSRRCSTIVEGRGGLLPPGPTGSPYLLGALCEDGIKQTM